MSWPRRETSAATRRPSASTRSALQPLSPRPIPSCGGMVDLSRMRPMIERPGGGDTSTRVGVLGLWHLGSVTAACLAEGGFDVVGLDPDPEVVAAMADGRPPVGEPGLAELMAADVEAGKLRVSVPDDAALAGLGVLWVAFD